MSIYSDICSIYKDFDERITGLQSATGMRCPADCSDCCREKHVEATVLELLPLAKEIYLRKEEDALMAAILKKLEAQDPVCVLLRNVTQDGNNGHCGYYEFRPLVCRLFGFASRRNKSGHIELMTCRIIKEGKQEEVRKAETVLSHGFKLPVYQDAFMSMSSMKPGIGTRRLPINMALKEAIEGHYWSSQTKDRD